MLYLEVYPVIDAQGRAGEEEVTAPVPSSQEPASEAERAAGLTREARWIF